MSHIVELAQVGFSAQAKELVKNLSFRFDEGKAVALIGPSGGGKSTLLKLAAGLCIPSYGKVLYRGKEIAAMSQQENLAFRREGAFVFQDAALWANQTLFQTLELPLRVHFPAMPAEERQQKVGDAVAKVGYRKELGIRPAALSRGEQKLIAFARAIICEPTILFLDEWTESLDENSAKRLVGIVRKMKERGATLIFVSHDPRVVRTLADVVLVVADGGISSRLTADDISDDEDIERLVEIGSA